ncbi:MAG TPA: hypothetical protein HPQ00_12600, partial [Magnetococcales bacterium]|nr:hypothetical protein [Magnetococcales bacterium]
MMSRTEAVFGVINARDANAGKDLCIISVPGDLRDEDWSGRFGKVQKEVLNAPEACLIILDLTITTWMDPLPTLSLAILLQQRYDQHQIKSHIFIGKGGRDQQTEEHRRLLKFLATQGFLKIFQQCCDFLWDHTVLDFDRMIITYCALDYPLRYRDPDCILAEMLNLEDESELESLVQRLVQQARMRALNDWLARTPALCDQTCHMLHGMLTELLLNIKEHAYTDTSKKYAGIYARIRLPKPAERDESAIWDRLRKKEDDFCPTIKYAEISPSDSWLEFFLCDLGVGLCHNLAQWPAPEDNPDAAKLLKKAAQSPAPLKELVKCLFHMAISSKNQPRSNQVTGLQQVGFLLNFQKDFIRIYSGGEWVGERMPWQRAEHNGAMRISALSRYAALDAVTSGTHYGIILRPARERLSYPDDHWIPYAPETKPNYSLSQALVSSPLEAVPATICSIDQRAAEVEPDFLKEVSLRQETESKDHNNLLINNINTILWLPASSVGKRDIFGIRDRIARTDRFEHVDRLIIADVERHVGIYLGWLMTKMKERSGKRLEVCLITRDWAVSCFVKDENKTTFYFNKEKTQDFLSGAVDEVNSVAYVFRLLRHMDSKFFWETLTNSPADEEHNVFVKEWIDWFENPKDEKFKLCGYLDFAQALTNPVRMEICQRAVLRTANALGHWRIYPADDLARSVLIRTGRLWDIAQVSGTHACDCEAIALGSVYVTGSTQRQLENRKDICLRGQMAVLRNPYSKNLIGESRNDSFHIATALDWIPKPDINSEWSPPPNELPYCRIPDTPFICRGGEDFQSLPRFEISQDGRELVSLYGQSPKDAYETWYRLGVLKLGHWVYNERHDLLTINLERAYLLDTMRHGEICKWIENTLEYYFQPAQKNGKPSDSALAQILVYPSHTVTDRIVQDMGRLYQNLLQGISIIPFKFLLGRHAVSPMRISPLTEERLRKSIALHTGSVSQKSGVVVFDDGTVTGKVFRELTLMIRSMGADKVYRMALLDRSGLPIHREMSKMFVEEHRRLWRWDVPDLGQKRSCPLCHTLDLVKDIRETNSNNQTRKRLDEWFDQWTP